MEEHSIWVRLVGLLSFISNSFIFSILILETHHPITRELARQTGFIVISVE
jgi:hypothetical protein